MQTSCGKRVCVIGTGIAGLVSAKVMLGDGFDVTVFDKAAELGGVWAHSRTYPGLHTNNPRDTYAFSDHPYPRTAADFPSAEQVREYLRSYAERFAISPRIHYDTEVKAVSPMASGEDGNWRVVVGAAKGNVPDHTHHFDYVVVCNGVFSEPFIPSIDGMEQFEGQVLHSSELADDGALAGKRVIVVGAGKSAHDCALWIAGRAKSCTLVFRRAHWMVPRYFFGFINTQWLTYSRFSEGALPPYKGGLDRSGLARARHRLTRLQWRLLASLFRRQFKVPLKLIPETALPEGLFLGGVSTGEFYRLVRTGSIRAKKGSIRRFRASRTVELDSGESLEADLVVFACGWRQSVSFLDQALRNRIERDGRFFLYRMIAPVGIANLGFIGYNTSTACQLTAEIAAHWLSECFLGSFRMPSAEQMEQEVHVLHQWADRHFPERNQGFFVGPYVAHYIDELLGDMGLRARRSTNLVAENLLPLWPSRYARLGEERRSRREQQEQGDRVGAT
jgi:cation diffusion facilitator CzcD-associated flavoprotein CzcO